MSTALTAQTPMSVADESAATAIPVVGQGRCELRATRHAIERYQQRVAPVDGMAALEALMTIAAAAKTRARPRHWMRDVTPYEPGMAFLYNSATPDVCLIVRNHPIVTVYARAACRRWRREKARADRVPENGRVDRSRRPVGRIDASNGPTRIVGPGWRDQLNGLELGMSEVADV